MTQITLAVSGSTYQAYKAADITSRLKKRTLMWLSPPWTQAATEFITSNSASIITRLVALDIMQEPDPSKVNHIAIAKESDLFLLAATINTIAKLANGLADNMVTATALALPIQTKENFGTSYEHKNVVKTR